MVQLDISKLYENIVVDEYDPDEMTAEIQVICKSCKLYFCIFKSFFMYKKLKNSYIYWKIAKWRLDQTAYNVYGRKIFCRCGIKVAEMYLDDFFLFRKELMEVITV